MDWTLALGNVPRTSQNDLPAPLIFRHPIEQMELTLLKSRTFNPVLIDARGHPVYHDGVLHWAGSLQLLIRFSSGLRGPGHTALSKSLLRSLPRSIHYTNILCHDGVE